MWIFSKTERKISVFKKLSGYLWTGPENPAPRSLACRHIGYLSINPYQGNKVYFTSLDFALLFFSLLYINVVNARKGDGTLVVVSRSYAVVRYKPTFV